MGRKSIFCSVGSNEDTEYIIMKTNTDFQASSLAELHFLSLGEHIVSHYCHLDWQPVAIFGFKIFLTDSCSCIYCECERDANNQGTLHRHGGTLTSPTDIPPQPVDQHSKF